MPLTRALQRLRDAGLQLVYSSSLVPDELRVLAEPRSSDPRGILDEILEQHGLAVRDGPGGTLLVVRAQGEGTGLVRGRVVGGLGSPVAARILVRPGEVETRSDRGGRFELRLAPGRYTLTVSAPGFISRTIGRVRVVEGDTVELEAALAPLEIVHESIRVTSGQDPAGDRPVGLVGLERESLAASPSLVEDPYVDVARLPGVGDSDTRAAPNVRGGRDDEVLVLFDGLEIGDPYHVRDLGGGMLSIFDAALVEEVRYYGGAFPSQFGNRTSAVMELVSTANPPRPEGSLTASTNYVRASGSGPMGKDGEWLVSGRVGNPELMIDTWVSESVYAPVFYDLLAKVSRPAGRRTTLAGHVLFATDESEDSLSPEEIEPGVDAEYENGYLWLTADTAWSTDVLSSTLLAWGGSDVDRRVGDTAFGILTDKREYRFLEAKQDWTAVVTPRHNLRWGFDVRWERATYDYRVPDLAIARSARVSGEGYALYVSDTFRMTPTLLLELGLRHDGETYTGLDDRVTSPRFNLAWSPGERTTLRAGWGRYHQFQRPYELQIEDGVETFQRVETSEHRQLVLEHRIGMVRGRVSVYEKSQHAVRSWFENQFDPLAIAPELRADRIEVRSERALSRGFELALAGTTSVGLDWSASYVSSFVEDRVGDRLEPRSWDQRHAADAELIYRIEQRWELGAAFAWHSGWPTTAVDAEAEDGAGGPVNVPVLGPRNAERYAAYGRLDLRAARRFALGRQSLEVFVNVANLTDRPNVCCTESFEFLPQPGGDVEVVPLERTGLDRTFAAGATWRF
jgi:hypothetical protein